MKSRVYILIFLFIFSSISLFAQEKADIKKSEFKIKKKKGLGDALKNIKYGDYFYNFSNEGSYLKALEYYLAAYEYNSENAELNYKTGVCYIESIYKQKSLSFLEKSFNSNPNVASDIYYYLGCAYHFNYQFDDAKKYLNLYLNTGKDEIKLKKSEKKIEECINATDLMKDTTLVFIENVENLNSEYKDYRPLINADGSEIFFTSRRKSIDGNVDLTDNQFFEDIFHSEHLTEGWETPNNSVNINSNTHDAAVGFSIDGQQLLVFINGDLYLSKLEGTKWSKPDILPKTINTDEIENSACFSPDGKIIYFVRGKTTDYETSNGDIYFSEKLEKNKWAEAQLLSSNVNTIYDEDGLYMNPDGKTLYFSSKGHNSMGGFDIFKTVLQDDRTWSVPVNLGYPINTPDDDIFFVSSANGKVAYYSAIREDSKGFNDIYKIVFPNGHNKLILSNEDNLISCLANPEKETYFEDNVKLTVIKGNVFDNLTDLPLEVEIEVIDNETNEVILTTNSNSATGEFILSLTAGKNYGIALYKEGYLFHSENFNLLNEEYY